MKKERITYGQTVTSRVYEEGLEGHQYIPQADRAILDTLAMLAARKGKIRVLDLGCGPGRLTRRMREIADVEVVGLDVSPEFIADARARDPRGDYRNSDFTHEDIEGTFDCIVMQGVFHHVAGSEREVWLQKMHDKLSPDGILVIGDEFIPKYKDEHDRKMKAGCFYLHIIDEAVRGAFDRLSYEEALNFLADTQSEEEMCGYYDDELIAYIIAGAAHTATMLRDRNVSRKKVYEYVEQLIEEVRECSETVRASGAQKKVDRGDRKISVEEMVSELKKLFELKKLRVIGPLETIGAMVVLIFQKQ